jgi:hypothetical protein
MSAEMRERAMRLGTRVTLAAGLGALALMAAPSAPAAAGYSATSGASATAVPKVGIAINTSPLVAGSTGHFVAAGLAGCTSGSTSDVILSGQRVGTALFLDLNKTFVCTDGDAFVLNFLVDIPSPCSPTDSATWTVVGGTGRYASMSGAGSSVGIYYGSAPCNHAGIIDLLAGHVAGVA